jgi:hypothetical protein
VNGECVDGAAIDSINPDGSATCTPHPAHVINTETRGGRLPLPNFDTFTVNADSLILIPLTATGYRAPADGPGPVAVDLDICSASPCPGPTLLWDTQAATYANATNSHTVATTFDEISLAPGTYWEGLTAEPGTSTDVNDSYTWSLIGFPTD